MIIFGEKGEDRFPACLPDTQIRSHPPHPLPAECCKGQPRKGVGDNNVRQPYCHTVSVLDSRMFVPLRGKCCPFFSFCFFGVWSGVFCRFFCRSSFLRVAFWKNFRERTFVFGWLCWSCVFWWVFAIVFALFFWRFAPETVWKILLMSGLVFSGFVLSSLGFSPTSFVFCLFFLLRDKVQVVTGHPCTRTCFSGFFSFLCPAAFVCSARFGRASRFLAFFRGAILGPGRFWGSPWTF